MASNEGEKTISKAESVKIESDYLRGTIAEEMNDDSIKKFTMNNENLLKFHGMYQQKDRDRRPPEQRKLGPKPFSLMIRGRIAGGRMTAEQWRTWDDLADDYGSDGLRVTTRQSLQLHGVLRGNIKDTVQRLHRSLSTTTGACGDVVRNVIQAPNPWGRQDLAELDGVADLISARYEVKTDAYADIFLDGEKVVQVAADSGADPLAEKRDEHVGSRTDDALETLYGRTYLPRKFKIAVTAAGNNSVDLFTHDLAIAATYGGEEKIDGFHVYVGGGMGMSHTDPSTFPRLAQHLGWVGQHELFPVLDAVIATQRDYGDRDDRSHARLKYTIEDKGLPWFLEEVQSRSGVVLEKRKEPKWQTPSYLGWTERDDGSWALGFHTLSGRIKDKPGHPLKTAIRHVIDEYKLDVQLTPEQDIVLLGIADDEKSAIDTYFRDHNINPISPAKIYDRALTCVALPMCVKALAEGERAGPEVFGTIQRLLVKHRVDDRAPVVRITGCPNGCARPYAAEIGLVGQLPGKYALFLGGHVEGTRLAFRVLDKVPVGDLETIFDRLFDFWKREGGVAEYLGDFVSRVPLNKLLSSIKPEEVTEGSNTSEAGVKA